MYHWPGLMPQRACPFSTNRSRPYLEGRDDVVALHAFLEHGEVALQGMRPGHLCDSDQAAPPHVGVQGCGDGDIFAVGKPEQLLMQLQARCFFDFPSQEVRLGRVLGALAAEVVHFESFESVGEVGAEWNFAYIMPRTDSMRLCAAGGRCYFLTKREPVRLWEVSPPIILLKWL